MILILGAATLYLTWLPGIGPQVSMSGVTISGGINIGQVHSVQLSWMASTTPNVDGYNVYRSDTQGGPYTVVNQTLVTGMTYTDYAVVAGHTYYYVATAQLGAAESAYSGEVGPATIPVVVSKDIPVP